MSKIDRLYTTIEEYEEELKNKDKINEALLYRGHRAWMYVEELEHGRIPELESEIEDLEKDNEELEDEIEDLEIKIDYLQSKNEEYLELLNERNIKISDLRIEIRYLQEHASLRNFEMSLREYQEKSKRTLNNNLNKQEQLDNMIFGIVGETGEIVDILKKHKFQGHALREEKIGEEIGDVMFYIVNLCNVLGFNLEEIIEQNYEKLLERYPNGFESNKSINRTR